MPHDKITIRNFLTAATLERGRRKGNRLDEAELSQLLQAREYVQINVADPVDFFLDLEDAGFKYARYIPPQREPS